MFRRSVEVPNQPATRPRGGIQSVCPESEMRWLLRRETARADRTGRAFSLVLFGVPAAGRRSSTGCRIARELLRHARLTDEVGWFSDEHLAALLPDTPEGGAKIFAARVSQAVARRTAEPRSIVYVYPGPDRSDEMVVQRRPRTANGTGHHNGHGFSQRESDHAVGGRLGVALAPPQTSSAFAAPAPRPGLSVNSVQDLLVHPVPLWKRSLDVMGAAIGLLLLFPVMALAAIGTRLSSPGPVIFRQKRSGLGGRPFVIYKFRTMTLDAENRKSELRPLSEQDGPAFKIENDPRLTRFGRFLRKTSIDELPQLWNVLKGDMSLVGPRPLPCDEAEACLPWHRRRLDVTPGLTCIWQVKGRSRVTFDEWVRMDVAYMRRRTLAHDLWLLFITVPAVLLRRGAR